jgi:hypothetical protein
MTHLKIRFKVERHSVLARGVGTLAVVLLVVFIATSPQSAAELARAAGSVLLDLGVAVANFLISATS